MNYKISLAIYKYYIYLIAIIMLTNGLLFNYIFSGSFLIIWRQIIWIICTSFLFTLIIQDYYRIKKSIQIFDHFKLSIGILLIASILTIIFNHYNVTRIIMGWMFYLFGYSFLTLPFIVINLKKEQSFFRFLTWLGIFISIGLLIEGLNIFSFSIFKTVYNEPGIDELNRATFLTEASTVLGISQVFFLICNFYTSHLAKTKLGQLFYISTSIVFVIGGWFTGSRQVFYILLFTELVAISHIIYNSSKIRIHTLFLIFFVIVIGYYYLEPIVARSNYDKLSERYTKDTDGGNETRLEGWSLGIQQFSLGNMPYWFTGHGFAYTFGQKALPDETVGPHMESSVWAMFSECGIFSWYVFFWPWIYSITLWYKLKKSFFKILILCFLLSYIFTAFISPNATHPLSTMCLFIVLGFLINLRYADRKLLNRFRIHAARANSHWHKTTLKHGDSSARYYISNPK